jgi:aminoglycoside phosphotransferase (APT) family kinase protein
VETTDVADASDARTWAEIAEEKAAAVPERLLKYLRRLSGDSELKYASPPARILGGASGALIFGFELSSPPDTLAGKLVLRMRVSEQTALWGRLWSRGLALQDAAGIFGCKAPRIRVAESDPEDLGGPFIIMDRVAGGSILRWLITSIFIGLIVSNVLWNGWFLLAGFLLGSLVVGLSLGMLQRSLHSLAIEDVKHIYSRYGLKDTDVEISQYLQMLSDILTDNNLEEFLPGLKWLQKYLPAMVRPRLCHGDIHPLNVLGTWTRVTGIIDWDSACIADPEFDVATLRCNVSLVYGRWIGTLLIPLYWIYLACQRERFDRERLRYYQALRTWTIAGFFTYYLVDQAINTEDTAGRIKYALLGMIVKNHTRLFHKITGIELPPVADLVAKRKAG